MFVSSVVKLTIRRNSVLRRSSIAVTALFLGFVLQATAADEPATAEQLISRMSIAAKQLNYDGVFVYQRGEHTDSMRIIHRTKNGRSLERLVSLSGAAREVLRDGERVICIFPENQAVLVEESRPKQILPTEFSQPIEAMAEHYDFRLLGADRIAGRQTRVVAIEPKGQFRYGYRLWIDDASGLLLKSNIVDSAGTALEQIQFTHIETPQSIADELLEPDISGRGYSWVTYEETDVQNAKQSDRWTVEWLPAGFRMSEQQMQAMSASHSPVNHMVYTDGLAMVSIFVDKLEQQDERLRGFSSMGAVNAYSTMFQEYQITVVGEVPSATVSKIAASVVMVTAP